MRYFGVSKGGEKETGPKTQKNGCAIDQFITSDRRLNAGLQRHLDRGPWRLHADAHSAHGIRTSFALHFYN